ncbi:MAG: dihydrolipoyl dehydrogenase [Janthinobacterium lividum]
MAETVFDVAVIGGGPAGYSCAFRAGQYGLKVALIEASDKLGGTCLHVGCVPTKAMLFSASIFDHANEGAMYGVENIGGGTINWPQVLKRKNDIINKHTAGLQYLVKKNKVTLVRGYGKLTGPAKDGVHTVDVEFEGKKQQIQAKKLVLASGSDARMIPGYTPNDKILTNVEILSLDKMPKSLVVIGSGAVGVEFASVFNSFKVPVTIIEMADRVVPAEDIDVSKEFLRQYKKKGIVCHTSAKMDKIEETADGVKVHFKTSDGKDNILEAEKVLIAIGRAPRTANLNLESTKIEMDRTSIKVDGYQQTAEPGIYAIGDIVAGLPLLAHGGSMSGAVAAAHIAGKYAKPVSRNRIPACTYCEPQIGSVGLTEAMAREQGLKIKVGKFPLAGNSKATIVNAHDGFVKVIADEQYGEVLGVHIIGPYATELIESAVVAMEAEMTIEELMFTQHPHPTLSESLLDGYSSVYGMSLNA